MKLVLAFLVLCGIGLGQQYPTPAKFITVGKLDCAGRLAGPTQFQTWCYRDKVLIINVIIDYKDRQANFTHDDESDPVNKINWVVNAFLDPVDGLAAWQATVTVGDNVTVLNGIF